MSGRRIAVVLPSDGSDSWYTENLRLGFAGVAGFLASEAWQVLLLDPAPEAAGVPPPHQSVEYRHIGPALGVLTAGPGPAAMTQALRDGHRVAQCLRQWQPEVVLAPLRRGVAQPLVMARAAGEAFERCAVAVWADAPAAVRLRQDDGAIADPGVLVDDALERSVLRYADSVLGPSERALAAVQALAPSGLGSAILSLPPAPWRLAGTPSSIRFHELVFVGPGARRCGLPLFLDAVEELGRAGDLAGIRITLLGPFRERAPGLSKSMIGVRAQSWPFEFRVIDAPGPAQALAHLRAPGLLPVLCGTVADDDVVAGALAAAGMPFLLASHHPLAPDGEESAAVWCVPRESLATAMRRALRSPASPPLRASTAAEWSGVLAKLCRDGWAQAVAADTAEPTVAVCITHRNRPECLLHALASVAGGGLRKPEIVVVDNASGLEARALLDRVEAEAWLGLRLIRLPEAIPQAAAYNRAAAEAGGEILVFLDDDNAIAPGGLRRFARACASGPFDVVVTCLDLYDGEDFSRPADGRLLFMGDAGSAGLFFNGFGDTAMAMRRSAFLALGGFDAAADSAPALDWVLLARARAAGMRIGVLQEPAIFYRREPGAAAHKWRKSDQEACRSAVLRAYAGRFDAELVARLAQGASLHAVVDC